MHKKQLVYVVDDDVNVREGLAALISSIGLETRAFGCAVDALDNVAHDSVGCIVTDIRMPGMNGIEFQEELKQRGILAPLIVISGFASTSLTVRAMKNGAYTLLDKPFDDQQLLDAVNEALAKDLAMRIEAERLLAVEGRISTLNEAEKQVLDLLIKGEANKCIAFELGVSLRTVESRRAQIFKKLGVKSVAEAVTMIIKATQVKAAG